MSAADDAQRCEPLLLMMTEDEIKLLSTKGAQGTLGNVRIVMNDKGYARIETTPDTRLDVVVNDQTMSTRSVFLSAEPVKQPPILVFLQQPLSSGQKNFECNTCVKRLHLTGDTSMVLE